MPRRMTCLAVLVLGLVNTSSTADERPLHQRIDSLIEAQAEDAAFAAPAGDAEFLRRVYLDLAGRIPTPDEARQFLTNESYGRRQQLVDQLLGGPDYPRRLRELLHVMLMERRGEHAEWTAFLRAACEQNMAWHQLVQAILRPDPDKENGRGAAFFFTQRLVKEGAMAPIDVPGLTRDVGRLFAGIDLKCAQCHDHFTVSDYTQRDFQGLHVIFENVQTRRDVKFPAIAEKVLDRKKDFMSVFTKQPRETNPLVPGGGEIPLPTYPPGEEYLVPPDKKKRTPGVPKFSPLAQLAQRLATPDNSLFARNIANRLWFVMMGRALVEPLDLQHAQNPPTHPELLEVLAHEFAQHDFDIRWYLRELALTKTYQRSTVLPKEPATGRQSYTVGAEKHLSAEQLFWSICTATGELDHWQSRHREAGADPQLTVDADSNEAFSLEQVVEQSADLKSLFDAMTKTFGNPPKEPEVDFTPTVKGALFLMHGEEFQSLVDCRPGNLIHRLCQLTDADQVSDELFLSILTRWPTDEDRQAVGKYLAQNSDRKAAALGNLAWALLTSTEFIVNH